MGWRIGSDLLIHANKLLLQAERSKWACWLWPLIKFPGFCYYLARAAAFALALMACCSGRQSRLPLPAPAEQA